MVKEIKSEVKTEITKQDDVEGQLLFDKLKGGKKLNSKESFTLGRYISSVAKLRVIRKTVFSTDYRRIFKDKPRSISRKLRDEKGKKIILKNNKYKIISDKPSEFTTSQFVALFRFKFKVTSNKTIVKVVPGYSPLLLSTQFKSEDDLVKLVYRKALAQFLTSIGYSDGSKSAERRIDVDLIDKFWITYLSYDAMINHEIAKAST